jgi:hypothetical protein
VSSGIGAFGEDGNFHAEGGISAHEMQQRQAEAAIDACLMQGMMRGGLMLGFGYHPGFYGDGMLRVDFTAAFVTLMAGSTVARDEY